jgi:hypothetical protein
MIKNTTSLTIRFDAEVFAYIQQAAKESCRSITQEINFISKEHVKDYFKKHHDIDILKGKQ